MGNLQDASVIGRIQYLAFLYKQSLTDKTETVVKAERWQLVEQLYHSTLEKEVGERADFLAAACAGDEGLRREVESLLAYDGAQVQR